MLLLNTKAHCWVCGSPQAEAPPSQEWAFMLSQKALQEFKQIWKEEYQEEISDEFAIEKGSDLLVLFDNIYRPVKKDWLEVADNSDDKTG